MSLPYVVTDENKRRHIDKFVLKSELPAKGRIYFEKGTGSHFRTLVKLPSGEGIIFTGGKDDKDVDLTLGQYVGECDGQPFSFEVVDKLPEPEKTNVGEPNSEVAPSQGEHAASETVRAEEDTQGTPSDLQRRDGD